MIERDAQDYADRVFFVGGPRKMVDEMTVPLKGIGLPEDSIKLSTSPASANATSSAAFFL